MQSYWDCLPEELRQLILWYRDHYTDHLQLCITEQEAVLQALSQQKKQEQKKLRRLKRKLYASVWAKRERSSTVLSPEIPVSLSQFLKKHDFEQYGKVDFYYRCGDYYSCKKYKREFKELAIEGGWMPWYFSKTSTESQMIGVFRAGENNIDYIGLLNLQRYWNEKLLGSPT